MFTWLTSTGERLKGICHRWPTTFGPSTSKHLEWTMKEALTVSDMIVDLRLDDGSDGTLGKWAWSGSVPRAGDTIEHEGRELDVTGVRWSTLDPRQVEVRVRASEPGRS
jgi:hypothetical protein